MAGNKYTNEKYIRPDQLGPESNEAKDLVAFKEELDRNTYGEEPKQKDKLREDTTLNRNNYETYIGIAMTMEDLCLVFGRTKEEMDEWSWKTYHMSFKSSYGLIFRLAQKELMSAFTTLAARGNPTAMQIAKEVVLKMGGDVGADTTRVVFVNDVPKKD